MIPSKYKNHPQGINSQGRSYVIIDTEKDPESGKWINGEMRWRWKHHVLYADNLEKEWIGENHYGKLIRL